MPQRQERRISTVASAGRVEARTDVVGNADNDTRTEREKMMAGDLYYSFAPKGADLEEDRATCRVKVAVRLRHFCVDSKVTFAVMLPQQQHG